MPHIHELVDHTVEVLIVHAGRVLIRLHDKYQKWLSVGGHIDPPEDAVQAAIREVAEEVGLKDIELWKGHLFREISSGEGYAELIPPVFMNRHRISETHEHVSLVYFATSSTDEVIEGEGEKSGGWKWCTREDLWNLPDLSEHMRAYALAALDALGGAQSQS